MLPPEYYVQLIKEQTSLQDVFVLTDDYRLFEKIQALAPDIHWYTLCSPEEKGYINNVFTKTIKERKQKQMVRFLCSMQILMESSLFIGSITTSPSLFLLKNFYPDIHPADCPPEIFQQTFSYTMAERGKIATDYVRKHFRSQTVSSNCSMVETVTGGR